MNYNINIISYNFFKKKIVHVSSVVYVSSACYLRGMTLNICFVKKRNGKSLHQIHSCHLFFEKGKFIINFIVWLLWPPMLFGPKAKNHKLICSHKYSFSGFQHSNYQKKVKVKRPNHQRACF